ncbi:hypothetical protein CKQ84_01865 [Shewanella sp. WE21]|jgi:hypothetical protein|uniref:ankyrin repeat domain-containing protein n=1 Tax=Shewanella sp. WE21 TaxID=2029986 RepID=UPI000CF64ACC|nr:ankyrin repeat domain-containing protein [Shewanella sp. WE21]AVI64726.1 hypothetical protein CKQ84_01865 [Shewanella sp. WE21]
MISLARFLAWFYAIISAIAAVSILTLYNSSYLLAIGIFMQGLVIFCLLSLVAQIAENTDPALSQLSSVAVTEKEPKSQVIINKDELHSAVWNGDYAAVRQLILDGADVNHKNADGKTSLDLAKERKDDLIVKLLHTYGAV